MSKLSKPFSPYSAWLRCYALLAVVAVTAVLSASFPGTGKAVAGSGSSKVLPSPPSGFGGYTWRGHLTEISAKWNVPTVADDGPGDFASTWIGAQSASGSFIQIGVTEQTASVLRTESRSTDSPQRKGSGSSTESGSTPGIYEAFWSDTAAGFHPVSIGSVSAAATVTASMTQTSSGWTIVISDLTGNWSKSIPVPYGQGVSYNQGEWLQEDPARSSDPQVDLPYAATSKVQFDDVVVDHRPVLLSYSDAQALSSSNGIYLVPSKFSDDSFSISQASSFEKQYLSDVSPYNYAAFILTFNEERWRNITPAERKKDVQLFALGMWRLDLEVSGQTWPASIQNSVRQLSQTNQNALEFIARWLDTEKPSYALPPDLPANDSPHAAADQVRIGLGLPPA